MDGNEGAGQVGSERSWKGRESFDFYAPLCLGIVRGTQILAGEVRQRRERERSDLHVEMGE